MGSNGEGVLMVVEKPILAESIARILLDGRCHTRKGRPTHFKMTSTCGHVMSRDFPSRYNNWDRVDPLELFGCAMEKKEANAAMKMKAYLLSEAQNCSQLVLWLGCEGENICFEWARFSAISDKDIKQAMAQLTRPNLNESQAIDARQELDLRIGCSFTRFQARYFPDKYRDLDSTCISFGPCQTLAFYVIRHDQIVQFKPEPYWILAVEVEGSKAC